MSISLPERLVEDDRCGHRRVQGTHTTEHRQADELVASITHQTVETLPLRTHDERDPAVVLGVVVVQLGLAGETHRPVAILLESLERLRQAADHGNPQVLHGARRCLGRGGRDLGRPVAGDDDAGDPGCLGATTDAAQVLRVLDPVQRQQHRRLLRRQLRQQVGQLQVAAPPDVGDHTLVRVAVADVVEALSIHLVDFDGVPGSQLQDLKQPRLALR